MKKLKLLFLCILQSLPLLAYADKVEIHGIYYNLYNAKMTAEVVSSPSANKYSGNITIPDQVTYGDMTYSVTSIGEDAFSSCKGLTLITIPNSVTSIGNHAFYGCTGLTSIEIPNSVTSISSSAFSQCISLTSIKVDLGNTKYDSRNNCNGIIKTESNTLIVGCKKTVIPNSVTSIGNGAFSDCSGLTSVTIPNSVTSIGSEAFYYCSGLTSIEIPNSVTSIGSSAFYGTAWYNNQSDGLVYAGKVAYKYKGTMTSGTSITLEKSTLGIAARAFGGCSGLTSVTIPNSVTSIGEYAFSGCTGLTSITIPNSVTTIGYGPFSGCSGLTSVTILCPKVGSWFYGNTSIKEVVLGESVTSIGERAFSGCSGLTSIEIPNSVTSIGYAAFRDCSSLTSLTIPNSLTSIGDDAFSGTAWYNNQSDGLVYAGKVAYKYKGTMTSGTSITLEEGTLGIAARAFEGCSGLTTLTIPNSVTSIGSSAFSGCSGLTSIVVPNSVTSIGSCTFYNCSSLTSLTLGNSVTSIGSYSFYYCSGLTSIEIPNSVTSIGSCAFAGCSGLTSVTIPNSVTSIGGSAFQECCSLTSVTIGNSVTSIGDGAFCECSSLTSLTIPNSVTSIGSHAFYNCSGLTSVTIPNSVTSIGEDAFKNCTGLTVLTFEDGDETLGFRNSNSFEGSPIETLWLGRNITGSPFKDKTTLKTLTISKNVTSIGLDAFSGCNSLMSLTLNCPEIGNWFSDSKAKVETLTLGEDVKVIQPSAFEGFTAIKSVAFPQGITKIGKKAFNGCSGLTEISIGAEIAEIGNLTFANCPKLEDVWCYAVRYPTTATDAFLNSHIDYATLHVPAKGLKQYKNQDPWNRFMRYVPIEKAENYVSTLTDAGYATFYDEVFDYALPDGMKACVVTKATDTKLTYKVIADGDRGDVIPAGVAVLLQGARRSADSYTLKPAEATASYTGANLLHGSDDATTTTADGDCLFYKLAYGPSGTELSKVLGWYWGEDEGRAFTIEGHKAWLAIPKSSAVKQRLFYSIEGDALELEGLSLIPSEGVETPDGEWYDLQGRRVTNVTAGGTPALPGIYICNGKKIYVK